MTIANRRTESMQLVPTRVRAIFLASFIKGATDGSVNTIDFVLGNQKIKASRVLATPKPAVNGQTKSKATETLPESSKPSKPSKGIVPDHKP
jgi:hypothetical protein